MRIGTSEESLQLRFNVIRCVRRVEYHQNRPRSCPIQSTSQLGLTVTRSEKQHPGVAVAVACGVFTREGGFSCALGPDDAHNVPVLLGVPEQQVKLLKF